MGEDEDLARRYRELAREEPPRHLDEAIRAAARRAVDSGPVPLVAPRGRPRWYFPLAAAAIIVLAVAVTLHVERQQPAEEVVVAEQKAEPAPEAKRERLAEASAAPELRAAPPAVPAPTPPPAPAAAQDAPRAVQESRADAAAEAAPSAAVAAPLAKLAERTPEQWLQGIVELRAQGRQDEADRELTEFRKHHPDYKIPQSVLEKLERR